MSEDDPPKEPLRVKAHPRCPQCHAHDNHVIRVRQRSRDFAVVRRHECVCGYRFTSTQQVNAA